MVHDSKLRLRCLNSMLADALPGGSFEVSGVKADNTVFIRVTSTTMMTATHAAFELIATFNALGYKFVQTADNKFRIPLEQVQV